MYGIVNLTVEERFYELAADILSSGRRPETLMKKYNIVYRKDKNIEDIKKAMQLSRVACEKKGGNHLVYIEEFSHRLKRVLMAQ